MIYYPKIYGTCSGANKAINLAYKLKKENKDKNIVIYKEILHNPYVIKELKKDNIICIDDLTKINKNDIIIIRAHGETLETFKHLEDNNIEYYDSTCINVKKVHDIVTEKYNNNFKIIIVGKKTHPEVIGTNSRCNNEAIIIESQNDYENINKNEKYYVVCQTTIGYETVSGLLNYLNINNIEYEHTNTICPHQKLIQSSSVSLSEQMDIMFIIGGKHSSNTKELYNQCKKVCARSYHVDDINEFYEIIKKEEISYTTKIGITAGGSTPKNQIQEFSNLLEFTIYYKNKVKELNKELNKYNKTLLNDNDNKIITDAVNKFINMNSDGKFLRGCLIDLGYKLNKNDDYLMRKINEATSWNWIFISIRTRKAA